MEEVGEVHYMRMREKDCPFSMGRDVFGKFGSAHSLGWMIWKKVLCTTLVSLAVGFSSHNLRSAGNSPDDYLQEEDLHLRSQPCLSLSGAWYHTFMGVICNRDYLR